MGGRSSVPPFEPCLARVPLSSPAFGKAVRACVSLSATRSRSGTSILRGSARCPAVPYLWPECLIVIPVCARRSGVEFPLALSRWFGTQYRSEKDHPMSRLASVILSACAVALIHCGVGSISFLDGSPARAQATADSFRDCDGCPKMIVVPAGEFMMGSPDKEVGRSPNEGPQHKVAMRRRLHLPNAGSRVGSSKNSRRTRSMPWVTSARSGRMES